MNNHKANEGSWEYWRDVMEDAKKMRRKRGEDNMRVIDLMRQHGVRVDLFNGGLQVRIEKRFDFWPTTGRWHDIKTGFRGRHVSSLISRVSIKRLGDEFPEAPRPYTQRGG